MLKIEHLTYAYDNNDRVLNDISFDVKNGEIICLLGASGCGKTTLLRVIAGLETDYQGEISFNGQNLRPVPVSERGFGFMFQDFALFPHLNVEDNVAYGLKRLGVKKSEVTSRSKNILDRVGLSGFGNRNVNSLSGGQKQRVALARSLAPNPRLLMLDEPLGSLDALLRDRLVIELSEIIRSIGLTALYVTHDQKEAYAVADRVAVMHEGRIEQLDTPHNLYFRPRTEFVARFLGLSNIFQPHRHPLLTELLKQLNMDARKILIHPTGISLEREEVPDNFIVISGEIVQSIFKGENVDLMVRIDNQLILKIVAPYRHWDLGEQVTISIDPKFVLSLD